MPFGRYQLLGLLGRGGMGEVWRAHDTVTERVVAIKTLPPQYSDDTTFQQRFRREALAAARLNSPHVIPIYDFGEIDGRLYVCMRLIEGRDLHAVISDGSLPPGRAVRIIEQVAKALHAAHKAGLVHRDVKPSNVLIDEDDFAYLIDFGIARATDDTRMTGTGNAIGTFQYMAPERMGDRPDDARADIYALTCVLYECLTGQPPFAGTTMASLVAAHLSNPPPRPSSTKPDVPQQFDTVITTGMAKDPDQRYATTIELAAAALAAITTPRATSPPNAPFDLATPPQATEEPADPIRLVSRATPTPPPADSGHPMPPPQPVAEVAADVVPPVAGSRQERRLVARSTPLDIRSNLTPQCGIDPAAATRQRLPNALVRPTPPPLMRRKSPVILTALAIVTMAASAIGFVACVLLDLVDSNDYGAYGEVPIPSTRTLHLPAGDVTVTFHDARSGASGSSSRPMPQLKLRITEPEAADAGNLKIDDSPGNATTINDDSRFRIGYVHVPSDGTYEIQVDGDVSGYVDPTLALGRGHNLGNLPMLFGAFFGLAVAILVIARAWARRVRRAAGLQAPEMN
jgi:serine/threonine protein kinase